MLKALYHLFFPDVCHHCHRTLLPNEHLLCLSCQMLLERIRDVEQFNPAERRLLRRFPFERGAAFCYYRRDQIFATLIKEAKYHGQPQVNRELTRLFLPELDRGGWPGDIDLIIPVPIHWIRRFRRGYNQSEPIAQALGEHWHIPVDTHSLVKTTYTSSQVTRDRANRQRNMEEHHPFRVRYPERLAGRHVLIVDDVHTSGATLCACAEVLLQVPGLRLSFLTLGLAGGDHMP
jgi:ComF family protein